MNPKTLLPQKSKTLFHTQTFIDKMICQKITKCSYWTEELFGITLEILVDKAISLKYIGGVLTSYEQPSKFLCLLLKLIQMQPEPNIINSLIENKSYKYVSALGILYHRLTAKPVEVYATLEQFMSDYRKLAYKNKYNQISVVYMDEYVDSLLREELIYDVNLPRLKKRTELEIEKLLDSRKSVLFENERDELSEVEIEQPKNKVSKIVEDDEDDDLYWVELRKKAGI